MMRARILSGGVAAEGPVMALDEPLSFWGAFEPRTGVILDVHHPQRGACVTGHMLVMSETRGSGSAPGAIAEAIRLGAAPAAIILGQPDINLAVGAEVAAALYGRHCVVASVGPEDLMRLRKARHARISPDGEVTLR
ncbi:MAG: aconitase X swivel domain-containing protein [Aestuariivirga sp.]|uniref:aconitase X swivel domain-containing protein n=1 Tax=Aestuariivirga sp. TaxID=2650926 RepID=UPI0038D08A78